MKATNITQAELVDLLTSIHHPKRVKLYTKTSAKLPKKFCTLGNVSKFTNFEGLLHFDKDDTIRSQQEEGYFDKLPAWGKKIKNTPLVTHKTNGDLYLRILHCGLIGRISYRNECGHCLKENEVKQFTDPTAKQINPFCYMVLRIDSIRAITIGRKVYSVH